MEFEFPVDVAGVVLDLEVTALAPDGVLARGAVRVGEVLDVEAQDCSTRLGPYRPWVSRSLLLLALAGADDGQPGVHERVDVHAAEDAVGGDAADPGLGPSGVPSRVRARRSRTMRRATAASPVFPSGVGVSGRRSRTTRPRYDGRRTLSPTYLGPQALSVAEPASACQGLWVSWRRGWLTPSGSVQ